MNKLGVGNENLSLLEFDCPVRGKVTLMGSVMFQKVDD